MAVNLIRHRRGIIDVNLAKEPGTHSLLALAGGVAEIPNSFFAAGWHRKSPHMVAASGTNECWLLHRDGGGQPAFYSANNLRDSAGYCLGRPDPSASCDSGNGVALRIPGCRFRLV